MKGKLFLERQKALKRKKLRELLKCYEQFSLSFITCQFYFYFIDIIKTIVQSNRFIIAIDNFVQNFFIHKLSIFN